MKTYFNSPKLFIAVILLISSCETSNKIFEQPQKTETRQAEKLMHTEILLPIQKEKEASANTLIREDIAAAPIREMSAISQGREMKRCGTAAPNFNTGFVQQDVQQNNESYESIAENTFSLSAENPLSTFSIDVDKASYSNCRRYINNGSLPPADAVRTEEFINYFDYKYAEPKDKPVAIYTEVSACPWKPENRLLHIGIQARKIPFESIPAMNLVFLVDVSGSMNEMNKLPLLKTSLQMLTKKLRPQDKVSLVAYAGAAGLVLAPTPGNDKLSILNAINNLSAGGSTAGGAGLLLAYKQAELSYIKNGINRVILATDGDFNVGQSSDKQMKELIESQKEKGITITTLGFGMGNLKDSKMESIADNGDGNSFYIDNADEARKVLVTEIASTLSLVAKDVKLQLEFNPSEVYAYRLVGYENRMLKKEDFNNDQKDAGDMGAGHTVTALYEIEPVDGRTNHSVDPLKYSKTNRKTEAPANEMLTVKLRYKEPSESSSKRIEQVVMDTKTENKNTSDNFRFSAAVAEFGMILHNSKWKGNANFGTVLNLAETAKGKDEEGYRAEFLKLVKTAQLLQEQQTVSMKEE